MGKHLTFDERMIIAQCLNEGVSFKAIAAELNKNCTTISRDVRSHLIFKKTFSLCKNCRLCNSVCKRFEPDICPNSWEYCYDDGWQMDYITALQFDEEMYETIKRMAEESSSCTLTFLPLNTTGKQPHTPSFRGGFYFKKSTIR